jgi:2-dehydropantoate 2-reductase
VKVAVIGAGAIGGLVAAYLKDKGEDVLLVARPQTAKKIQADGLKVSGCRGSLQVKIEAVERLTAPADLIILATKTQDLEAALKENRQFLPGAAVLTTQNGVSGDEIAAAFVLKEEIISSIVMFGATSLEPGRVLHNFEGGWIIGRPFGKKDAEVEAVCRLLGQIFPVTLAAEIRGMKYLKLFVNANNCIPAILGVSMQETFSNAEVSRIAMAVWKEGLEVINRCGIRLVSLPDFSLERLAKLAALPLTESAKIYSGIMTNLSKEPLYGSILQSIKRGKPSEIDYLNGEFVALAENSGSAAPLNKKLVGLVHQVEGSRKFLSKDELINCTKAWVA